MYEDRLRYLRMTQGRFEKEVVDKSNNPRVFKKAAESAEPSSGENSTPSTHQK
jgi:hypothetical protein